MAVAHFVCLPACLPAADVLLRSLLRAGLQARLSQYSTSLQHDQVSLSSLRPCLHAAPQALLTHARRLPPCLWWVVLQALLSDPTNGLSSHERLAVSYRAGQKALAHRLLNTLYGSSGQEEDPSTDGAATCPADLDEEEDEEVLEGSALEAAVQHFNAWFDNQGPPVRQADRQADPWTTSTCHPSEPTHRRPLPV